jgi:hypothetical protein
MVVISNIHPEKRECGLDCPQLLNKRRLGELLVGFGFVAANDTVIARPDQA